MLRSTIFAILILLSGCTIPPAKEQEEAPVCFNAVEQEALNNSIRTMLQKAFQAGFERGVAHERSTI